jgi:tRNA(fMet)-specific endonuclease VapC
MTTTRQRAQIRAAAHHKGKAISPQDAWVAATALQYNLPFLTHNHADYEHVEGLNLVKLSA